MAITVPIPITELPIPPTTADPVDFDPRMDATLIATKLMVTQQNVQNQTTYQNALASKAAADAAVAAGAGISEDAQAAAEAAEAAEAAKIAAQAAAQAAAAGAGLPALVNNSFLQVNGAGALSFLPKTSETTWPKKVGGKVQSLGFTFIDDGEIGGGELVTCLFSDGEVHRVEATSEFQISFGGWQASGTRCEMEIECVNFGGKTITWDTLRWVIAGGAYTTIASNNGVTFQTSGIDYLLLWTDDGGATIYAKVLR